MVFLLLDLGTYKIPYHDFAFPHAITNRFHSYSILKK